MSTVQSQFHSAAANSQLPNNLNLNLAGTAMPQQPRQFNTIPPFLYSSPSQPPQSTQNLSQPPSRRAQAQSLPPNQLQFHPLPLDPHSLSQDPTGPPVNFNQPQLGLPMQPSVLLPLTSGQPSGGFQPGHQRGNGPQNTSRNAMSMPANNASGSISSGPPFTSALGPLTQSTPTMSSTVPRRQPSSGSTMSLPNQSVQQHQSQLSSNAVGLNLSLGTTMVGMVPTPTQAIARGGQVPISRQPQSSNLHELQQQGLGQPNMQSTSQSQNMQSVNGQRLPRQQPPSNLSHSLAQGQPAPTGIPGPSGMHPAQRMPSVSQPPTLTQAHSDMMHQSFQGAPAHSQDVNPPLLNGPSSMHHLRETSILHRPLPVGTDQTVPVLPRAHPGSSPEPPISAPQRAPSRTSSRTSLNGAVVGDGLTQQLAAEQDIMSQLPPFVPTPVQQLGRQSNHANPLSGTVPGTPHSSSQDASQVSQTRHSQDTTSVHPEVREQTTRNVSNTRPSLLRSHGTPQSTHRPVTHPTFGSQRALSNSGVTPGTGSPTLPPAIRQPIQAQSASHTHSLPIPQSSSLPLGQGQALLFLLQFAGALTFDRPEASHRAFWDRVVDEFFHPEGVMRFTLWKDNLRQEAKPFDVGLKILPRFFAVAALSGVKAMSFSLDGASERIVQGMEGSSPYAVVECRNAGWIYQYHSGYTVILRGPLIVDVHVDYPTDGSPRYWIKCFNFDASTHEQQISVEAIKGTHQLSDTQPPMGKPFLDDSRIVYDKASIPPEPINAFGIPQETMRCLELAESCELMTELMVFSRTHEIGPSDALKSYASQIRENHPSFGNQARNLQIHTITQPHTASSVYPSATPTTGMLNQTHSRNTPPPISSSTNGLPVLPAALPTQHVDNNAPASSSSTPMSNLPQTSNATPPSPSKRKTQNDTAATDSGPPSKRPTRARKPKPN